MSKTTRAIIYVRGHNQESQEVVCRLFALDKGYKVIYTTSDIRDVKKCDVLLITNRSRISRNQFEYYKIMARLKLLGVKVESASDQNNFADNLYLAADLIERDYKRNREG